MVMVFVFVFAFEIVVVMVVAVVVEVVVIGFWGGDVQKEEGAVALQKRAALFCFDSVLHMEQMFHLS
jgi:hypothetical protein